MSKARSFVSKVRSQPYRIQEKNTKNSPRVLPSASNNCLQDDQKVVNISSIGHRKSCGLAKKILESGGVISMPTDTIYGLACLCQNEEAVAKIYKIKKRDFGKPLAISVARIDDIEKWVKVTVSKELLEELLPGPVTLVFQRLSSVCPTLNPTNPLLGVRIPAHGFVREVSELCSEPIALTSANLSSELSPLSIEDFSFLWPKLDKVFDGGIIKGSHMSREGSTVVDLSMAPFFSIIRNGCAFKQTLEILNKFGLKEESPK